MDFSGQMTVVTGAARGLGRCIALTFARLGSDVAACDLAPPEDVAGEIRALGRRALALGGDVSKSADVSRMFEAIFSEFGRVDILVNNAGIVRPKPILDITEDEWDTMMAVNLKSVFLCAKAVMPSMKERRSGRIVNMGSVAGKTGGLLSGANYAASKAGVICLTKSLARELAPFGVTANAVAPGIIESAMTQFITGGNWDEYIRAVPMGYVGAAEDVAQAVVYLASEAGRYITGEILDVNGGMFMD